MAACVVQPTGVPQHSFASIYCGSKLNHDIGLVILEETLELFTAFGGNICTFKKAGNISPLKQDLFFTLPLAPPPGWASVTAQASVAKSISLCSCSETASPSAS